MNKIALITPALLLAAGLAVAQKPVAANEQDHQAHHPEGTASAAAQPTAKPVPKAAAAPGKESMGGDMGAKMKAMQEMHQKMMAAKTPEERAVQRDRIVPPRPAAFADDPCFTSRSRRRVA